MCEHINTDRVLRLRLIFEDYGPDIEYIKGEKNIRVYGLSKISFNGYFW